MNMIEMFIINKYLIRKETITYAELQGIILWDGLNINISSVIGYK